MIVCLDPGHGKGNVNSSPDKTYYEYECVQSIVDIAEQILKQYNNIKLIKTKNINDPDVNLIDRSNIANKANADLFISVHTNAHGSGQWTDANGFEVYHYPGSINGNKIASIIHKHAISELNVFDRGIKSANFSVLRETKMPACLIEFLFHTNKQDCELLKSKEFRKQCAEVIVSSILEWFGLNKTSQTPSTQQTKGTSILGQPQLSADHMNYVIKSQNPNAPEVADYYINYGKEMNIRGDIALCQAIVETGWFSFKGDVANNQNNFCGLGAVGNSAKGASFSTPRQGVLAHLQHLWAYATNQPLSNQEIIDPRFHLIKRSIAPTWELLGGKWAVPGFDSKKYSSFEDAYKNNDTYGQNILKLYENIKNITPPSSQEKKVVEDGSDLIKKENKNEVVFYTITNIDSLQIPSVVINGKGYIAVKEIGQHFNYTAKYDTVNKEILLINRRNL